MNGNGSKEEKLTMRYDDEIGVLLERLTKKYNISKSECARRGILLLANPNQANILPQLCSLCSVVNETIEIADMNTETKEYLKEGLAGIWEQLR